MFFSWEVGTVKAWVVGLSSLPGYRVMNNEIITGCIDSSMTYQ